MRIRYRQIVMRINRSYLVNILHLPRYSSASLLVILAAMIYCAPICFNPASAQSKYAAFIVDHSNGRILYSRNADKPRFPASLTKMMTLYLLFEALEQGRLTFETLMVVTPNAEAQPPSKLGLKVGQTINVRDAIRSLITKSANDVAVTVAENLAQDEKSFARIMTSRAHRMGMHSTTFRNASGLPDSSQLTTARDMVTLSRRLISDFPSQYRLFRTRYFHYHGRKYKNHNRLLFSFEGTEGIKTGYTRASGFNLSASVRRGKKHVVGVVMGGKTAKKRDAHMRNLLRKALKNAKNYSEPVRIASKPYRLKEPPEKIVIYQGKYVPQQKYNSRGRYSGPSNVTGGTMEMAGLERQNRRAATEPSEHEKPVDAVYDIQIGAYSSEGEARSQLENVYSRAENLLNGHRPITRQVVVKKKRYFRARFASFNRLQALSTCKQLEAKSIDCVAMLSY